MDPRENPYAPGAGAPPPELAGRTQLIERVAIALDRIRLGNHAKSVLIVGLRGVGKTVLLNRIRRDAESRGIVPVSIEASEGRSLPSLLIPPLRAALIKLDTAEKAGDLVRRGFRALGSFVSHLSVTIGDVAFGLDLDEEPGVADSGDLNNDLGDLLDAMGRAAQERSTALVLFIDELQYVEQSQLAALISALHRCVQAMLPITLVGAGLPQLVGNAGRAKSYAERLFEFPAVGPLESAAAAAALEVPARKLGVSFEPDAVAQIVRETQAYPYFLQEWGKHSWDVADDSPITAADVTTARARAIAELDASFFRVRLDRLTPTEKRYLGAMAILGPGPHRSGDIAAELGVKVQSVGPVRASLIDKGMVYSPSHGDTAFTVPLFDEFMRRALPKGLH